ncbi:MAG: type II secretion system secretin GspD [Rhizomicrobium sp.]
MIRSSLLPATILGTVLAGCIAPQFSAADPAAAPSKPQATTAVAPSPDSAPSAPARSAERPLPTRSDIMRGSGIVMDHAPPPPPPAGPGKGDITLNFVAASVQDVAKAILGDMLGLNYAVDPSVQGTVSVETTAPVRRDQVLGVFQASLAAARLALVQSGDLYTIVPVSLAQHRGTLLDAANAGYGSEAVQLRYVNAGALKKILDPLVPDNGITQADDARNVLFVTGAAGQRQQIRELIKQFDVNWLKGMSFALFVPQWSDSQSLAGQLAQILSADGTPTAGLVRIVPIQQVNGILAISPQAEYLEKVRQIVEMLDREGQGSQRRLFVYNVQNGRAAELAASLSAAFGGGQAAASAASGPTGLASAGGQSGAATPTGVKPPGPQALSTGSDLNVNGTAPPISQALQVGGARQELTITADETNNALIVYATPPQYEIIMSALRKLDVLPLQVMIEAAITEVTLTDKLNYGVQWFFHNGQSTFGLTQGATAAPAQMFPGFSYLLSNGDNIQVMLNALSNVTKVHVLSSPQLFVLNNHTATLQVGDQVPVATQSAVGIETGTAPIVNSIEYRDTGVILKVTPRVNDSGLVLLDIAQEVSDVSTTDSSDLDSPTIQQRRIASSVAVQDGQTIALGGLIKDNQSNGSTGIPFLRTIPVLGNLFGATNDEHDRTELLVLLTPHVVRNPTDARAVTEELREKIQGIVPLPPPGEPHG